MKGTLFIISAPSGAGKTTLVHKASDYLKDQVCIEWVITYTTKVPRSGEQEGKDYHFISRERFDELLAEGFFMEYSKAYTDYYGSPASVVGGLARGISYLLIVDRIGAQEIVKKVPEAVLIWIGVPSLKELEKRLIRRGDAMEAIERRLKRAQEEIKLEKKSPFYTYHLLNDKASKAEKELIGLIKGILAKKSAVGLSQLAWEEGHELSLLEARERSFFGAEKGRVFIKRVKVEKK